MKKTKLKIGIVGATGKVGQVFLKLLEQRKTPISELMLFASEKSAGKKILFRRKKYSVKKLSANCFKGLDLVFFSSGEEISLKWAPKALKEKALVVDNSAAFRDSHKLIVNEVNSHLLKKTPEIIANPNCSTMQLMLLIHPLKSHFSISNVQVATYQSVSGYGYLAEKELMHQLECFLKNKKAKKPQVFNRAIAFNSIPEVGSFNSEGLCTEEEKMIKETRKILKSASFALSPFTVRVPSLNGHAQAVWVRFKKEVSKKDILKVLKKQAGLCVKDKDYMTVREVDGTDDVFVSRIHKDPTQSKTWKFWVTADNLRKGAALNSLQVAESFFKLNRN